MRSKTVQQGLQMITLAELADWAQELMAGDPNTPEARQTIVDASRATAHILDDPECLHPVYRRGDLRGQRITPTHHVVDLVQGRCFFTASYKTKGHVDAAYKRGLAVGLKRGTREAQQAVIAAND